MTSKDPSDPALPDLATTSLAEATELRGVLRYREFRQLWIALSLSSLGDWLGLIATTALASSLAGGGIRNASFAVGGVLIFRLMPAVILGPVAGAFADRFDRRRTMVVCDLLRFALFVSIPIADELWYLLVASFLIESVSLFWIPAKEASVPNLLPPAKLEAANQLSLITTYGSAPIAAAIFASLAVISRALGAGLPFFKARPVDLALYFDAATFLVSAITVARLTKISAVRRPLTADAAHRGPTSILRDITEGWQFVVRTRVIRGLVIGMLGAFAAGGTVIALGRVFVGVLKGGDAAYGLLFGSVFAGLALGMALGPRVFGNFSRRPLFGLAIIAAGLSLAVMALLPNLILALFATLGVGLFAGIAWVTGYTLLGLEVEDHVRGRTFAFVQSLVRVDLLVVLATAPFISGFIGAHSVTVGRAEVRLDGITITLFAAGVLGVCVGLVSLRQMDDRRGLELWRDLWDALLRRGASMLRPAYPGLFVAFEGGEGAGKSTQVELLADELRRRGHDVVVTCEPGGTPLGRKFRALLLDRRNGTIDARTEALLYAADRAQHVATVVRPALERGSVVITDRYIDSSLAYQGGGRKLSVDTVEHLSTWATGQLAPDLTVLLDVTPDVGLGRLRGRADRIEAEAEEFHRRVRETFLTLAARAPQRYLKVDASLAPDAVHERLLAEVMHRLEARASVDQAPTVVMPTT